jgi:Domain of unknown function (DUF4868)
MAINFDQERLARLGHALDAPIEMIIGTWTPPDSDHTFDLSRLRLNQNIAAEFRAVGHRYIARLAQAETIQLDLGFTPDDDRIMQIAMADFDEPDLVQRILNPGNIPFFEFDQKAPIAFHCFLARLDDTRAGFMHHASSVALARQNKIFGVFEGDVVARLQANVLTFSPAVDLLLEPDVIWVSNIAGFRALFRTMPTLLAGVQEDIGAVTAHMPIANLEDFRNACLGDAKMMAKLAHVARRPYLAAITPVQIREVIDRYHLPPDLLNEDGQLVHANSPSRRWLILRILDDSYLESLMTHTHYEVNSKLIVN